MKKTLVIALLLSLSLMIVGCNKTTETSTDSNLSNSGDQVKVVENQKSVNEVEEETMAKVEESKKEDSLNSKDQESSVEKENTQDYNVSLVYPSTAYIVDGNEDEKFVKNSKTLKASEDDIVEKVLDNLKKSSTDEAEPVGLDNFTINKAYLEEGKAIVDFSSDGLNGSGMEEEVLVTSIVDSLLSVDGVKSVKFLVDGKDSDSLMGHMDTSQAYTNFIGE